MKMEWEFLKLCHTCLLWLDSDVHARTTFTVILYLAEDTCKVLADAQLRVTRFIITTKNKMNISYILVCLVIYFNTYWNHVDHQAYKLFLAKEDGWTWKHKKEFSQLHKTGDLWRNANKMELQSFEFANYQKFCRKAHIFTSSKKRKAYMSISLRPILCIYAATYR